MRVILPSVIRKRSVSLGIFSASFFVVLAIQPGSAFTVNPLAPLCAFGKCERQATYTLGGGETTWMVDLNPGNVTLIDKKEDRNAFKSFLDNSIFGKAVADGGLGWSFNLKPLKTLKGTFDIQNYYACAPVVSLLVKIGVGNCGKEYAGKIVQHNGVGAFLDISLSYDPKGIGQPEKAPDKNDFRWIQRLINNHKGGAKHGVNDDKIDNGGSTINPFYPYPAIPGLESSLFADNPGRFDVANDHQMKFSLFLVHESSSKKVDIYDGVSWGWTNSCKLPPPNPKGLFPFAETDATDSCQDFGDAPESFQTLKASNGPRYQEGQLQHLGELWDSEIDGQPTYLANGDDINGGCNCGIDPDDEDGVVFGENWVDVTFNITRPDSYPYQLRAWWDTNYDGVFDDTSERYINDLLTLSPGSLTEPKRYNLGFNPKAYGLYSRFRLTWDPLDLDVKPYGEYYSKADCTIDDAAAENCTSHGEVEDYVHVPAPLPLLGVGAAFGYSRKLRKRIKTRKTPVGMSTID